MPLSPTPVAVFVAEDTDSYTKEETKSTKFINLTHAASMTRQPSQSPLTATPPPPPPPGGQARLHGAASGALPRQFSFSQMSEASSGLPHTSDGWDSAGPSWLGSPSAGTSWLAKAAPSNAPAVTSPMSSGMPVPPAADEQVKQSCTNLLKAFISTHSQHCLTVDVLLLGRILV